MQDEDKTQKQLMGELKELRNQLMQLDSKNRS